MNANEDPADDSVAERFDFVGETVLFVDGNAFKHVEAVL